MVSTQLNNISQNGSIPQVGDENKKYLKPPPRIGFVLGKCQLLTWQTWMQPSSPPNLARQIHRETRCRDEPNIPIPSMGLVYLPTWMLDLYGKCRHVCRKEPDFCCRIFMGKYSLSTAAFFSPGAPPFHVRKVPHVRWPDSNHEDWAPQVVATFENWEIRDGYLRYTLED